MRYLYFIIFILFISCKQTQYSTDFKSSSIQTDVRYLASDALKGRKIGTPGEQMAALFIAKRFKALGLSSYPANQDYLQYFSVNKNAHPHAFPAEDGVDEIKGKNVVAYIDNGADQNIVLGGHYDHLGMGEFGSLHMGAPQIHNGADDNASGIAALLQLAKDLQTASKDYNYIFIAFSGEEMGLWGSNYWIKNPDVDVSSIAYMINMDMIGRLNKERKLHISGTGTSPRFESILDQANSYKFSLVKSASGMGPSDFSSFYNADIPVLSFFTGQHEDYHKPSDDIEKLNYQGIMDIAKYINSIVHMVNKEGRPKFTKTKDEEQTRMDFKVTLGVMPDYLYDGEGMRIDGVREGRTASNAGIQKGDIVLKIASIEVMDMMSYMKALGEFEEGQTVDIVIKRDGKEMVKEATFVK